MPDKVLSRSKVRFRLRSRISSQRATKPQPGRPACALTPKRISKESGAVAKPPSRHRAPDVHSVAEAAFKKATTKPVEVAPQPKKVFLPGAKETVPLRIDRDVLEHFQEDGPGWQERINSALRKAAGLE